MIEWFWVAVQYSGCTLIVPVPYRSIYPLSFHIFYKESQGTKSEFRLNSVSDGHFLHFFWIPATEFRRNSEFEILNSVSADSGGIPPEFRIGISESEFRLKKSEQIGIPFDVHVHLEFMRISIYVYNCMQNWIFLIRKKSKLVLARYYSDNHFLAKIFFYCFLI